MMKIRNLCVLTILLLLCSCMLKKQTSHYKLVFEQPYRLTHFGSKHVDQKNAPTIIFKENGRLVGDGGCNKWMGTYEIIDEKAQTLKILSPASSLMMCEQSLMEQETKFLQMLPSMVKYKVDNKQRLVLNPGSGNLLAFEFIGKSK